MKITKQKNTATFYFLFAFKRKKYKQIFNLNRLWVWHVGKKSKKPR